MNHTHTPAEWAEVLATSTAVAGVLFAPVLALDHQPHLPDLTPQIAASTRAVAEVRDRARLALVAGLLVLVTHLDPTPQKGALR